MLKSRKKKIDKFLKIVNIILFSVILVVGLILILIMSEKNGSVELVNAKSLSSPSKEQTMRSNEIEENNAVVVDDNYLEAEEAVKEKVDPDLEYAIKLFESKTNKQIAKKFKKPFNYKEGSYCKTRFYLNKGTFKFLECNGDAIYKRELQLAIEEIMPIERFTYNNINLGKKELIVILNTDK